MTSDTENTETPETEIAEETENTDLTTKDETQFSKRQRLRRWVLKLAIILAVLGPLVFLIAALGYRLGVLGLGTSLKALSFQVGPIVLILGLIVSLASLALSWFIKPRKGLIVSLLVLAIPAFGLLKFASAYSTFKEVPPIHDITTDLDDPPLFTQAIVEARNQTKGVNTLDYIGKKHKKDGTLVSVLQSQYYKEVRPIRRSEDPDVVFKEAEALIKSKGWKVVTVDAESGVLEATESTFWYGFKDDVIIRVRPSKGGGTVVDMRSISRIGGSDLGLNAKRLEALISALEPK